MAPGISFPTEGRVLRNSALRWALGHTTSGEAAVGDDARWIKLDLQWYRSGKPYWSLDRLITPRTAVFRTWLTHPSYDRYWQKMIPFRQQFARVDIPVLTIGGYYGDVGALYYFSEHQRYRPAADQTLVIGPYDDELRLERPAATLRGLTVDPVAQLDLRELQYQWFDQVLKGKPAPPLLKDRVNYQLMGTDQWRHTPSLAAMAGTRRRLYLQKGSAERLRLTSAAPADAGFVEQTVDFKDRSDLAPAATTAVFGNKLALRHALAFVSEPLSAPTELAGLVSGLLDFRVNKMDMDLNLTLYEQRVSGEYLRLSDPNEFRASYAADRVHRHLLRAGMRQQLKFSSERIVGCKLLAGSRLVVVLGVNKQPHRQINYGAGKNVSEESIADAGAPLKIRWYGASYVDLPMRP
jgi:putative CocE/NonD family hydrolase